MQKPRVRETLHQKHWLGLELNWDGLGQCQTMYLQFLVNTELSESSLLRLVTHLMWIEKYLSRHVIAIP